MKTRVVSSIIVMAICAVCIFFGGIWLDILVLFAAAVGLFEIYRAFENKDLKPVWVVGYAYVALLALQIFSGSQSMMELHIDYKGLADVNLFPVAQLVIFIVLLALCVFAHKKHNANDVAVTIFGGFYAVWLCSFFLPVRGANGGLYLFIMVLLTGIAADTFAFLVGSFFGKHKLIPEVSPKKTVEGSIGAFAGAIIIASVCGIIFIKSGVYETLSFIHYPIMGLLIGGLAQIGDLTASSIKRYTGIKDFGKLIPGHGGVLDRIDSHIFVFPIIYYYLRIFTAGL